MAQLKLAKKSDLVAAAAVAAAAQTDATSALFGLSGKSNVGHTHTAGDISGLALNTGRWDPMGLRAGQTAHALDEDWSLTGTVLPAGWTTVNWPPTAFDVGVSKPGYLYVKTTVNSTGLFGLMKAIPSGDFVIQTEISVNRRTTNLCHGDLILSDGTAGGSHIITATNYHDGGVGQGVQSGTFGNIDVNIMVPRVFQLSPVVFRIERVSGAYTYEFSDDGIVGYRFAVTPAFTMTNFGIGGSAWTSTPELRALFGKIRYSATPATRWGIFT